MELVDIEKEIHQECFVLDHQNQDFVCIEEGGINKFQDLSIIDDYGISHSFAPGGPPPLPIGLINPNFDPYSNRFVQVNPIFVWPLGPGLNPVLFKMELQRSLTLAKFLAGEGLIASKEEEMRRRNVIDKLKQIVTKWIKRVAYQRQLPKNHIRSASATILTYGSYGLGVHNSESDIDALCIGPSFATLSEDFFIALHDILVSRPEVSDMHCIKDAKVPLMRFKFEGILIDLPYAQLKVKSVPEDVDIFNPYFLRNIDETSWKSLSGVRANKSLLLLVPNVERFQSLLRCVKLWAKRRGVYGNLLGYFGGIHLAVLVAFVCQRNSSAMLSALVCNFYKTFTSWIWPTPVILEDGITRSFIQIETRSLIPIQLPCNPYEYCHSNITRSTFFRIQTEFHRGFMITKNILRTDFSWSLLFEPFPYSKSYWWFVKISLSASNGDDLRDWVGWAKSRFRCLLLKLEELEGFCDPNPTEYVDADVWEPNVVFYWGLQHSRRNKIDVKSVEEDFRNNIASGNQGPSGRIELSVVRASQLPKNAQWNTGKRSSKQCWRVLQKEQPPRKQVYSDDMPQYEDKSETSGDSDCPISVG
ncbi:hypothetical protein Leryth_017346 [Lithospermum erythrorhizon]|nr:hypothetical protein Leryth_017346 [Lithospermum erythrorhizon]